MGYFSLHNDKIPEKKQLEGKRIYFGSWFKTI